MRDDEDDEGLEEWLATPQPGGLPSGRHQTWDTVRAWSEGCLALLSIVTAVVIVVVGVVALIMWLVGLVR